MVRRLLPILLLPFFMPGAHSPMEGVYVAGSAQGRGTGQSCADALPYTFLSDISRWGTGAGMIGAGTTIHLCGRIQAPRDSTGPLLEFRESGEPGRPVSIAFEPGASLEAPSWEKYGAIYCKERQYIVIDGGKDGTIRATRNGTNLEYQRDGAAIYLMACSHAEIRKLTISNIYVHASPADEQGQNTYGVHWDGGSDVALDGNTVQDAKWCLFYSYPGGIVSSGLSIFSNATYNCDHGIVVGSANYNAVLSGANAVHDNVAHDWENWDDSRNYNHHDAIHVWAAQEGSKVQSLSIYNNLSYGRPGTHMNAHIYLDGAPGVVSGAFVFNNVMINDTEDHIACAFICDSGEGTQVYSNTMRGRVTDNRGIACINVYRSGQVSMNNICSGAYVGIYIHPHTSIEMSDFNDFHNVNAVGYDGTSWYKEITAWSRATGFDNHSTTGDPLLTANYHLAGQRSAAWQSGRNLEATSPPELKFDRVGTPRPVKGPWDLGAYEDSARRPEPNF